MAGTTKKDAGAVSKATSVKKAPKKAGSDSKTNGAGSSHTTSDELVTFGGKHVATAHAAAFTSHHKLLIIGGGSAGITMGAMMAAKMDDPDVAILEPTETHYYQPMWTLVGAGVTSKESTMRPMAEVMPKDVVWIKDAAATLLPNQNLVLTRSGRAISYEFLIVAPGIQINWDAIPGLAENIGTKGICSNYSYRHVEYTFECIKSVRGGRAIFTNPATPIKCGGAPHKIMYLTADYLRRHGGPKETEILYNSAGGVIFGVERIKKTLEKVIARYGIVTNFGHNLVELRPDKKEAVFDILKEGKPVDRKVFTYDMIHVTPPMSAPDFVRNSPLANEAGWVDVDHSTLQHLRYPNVFGLGDASSCPTAKTGAAIRKQAKVLGENLWQVMTKGSLTKGASYNGYSSCPLVTGYGKAVLAEFDYKNQMDQSFPIDQSKERTSMYILKKYGIPFIYWNMMLKGRV